MFSAVVMHWDVLPSLINARWALFMSFGLRRIMSPIRTARSFEEIFPNSWSTDIGLISPTAFVSEPSSLRLGTIEIIAFRQEIGVAPDVNASLVSVTRTLRSGVGSLI